MTRQWIAVCLTLLMFPAVVYLALAQAPEEPKAPEKLPDASTVLPKPQDPKTPDAPPLLPITEGPQLLDPPPMIQQPDEPKPQQKSPDVPKDEKKGPAGGPGGDLKDPTTPSQKLKDVLYGVKTAGPGPVNKLPSMVLRGRIITKDRPPAAILELDGRLYVVAKDSVLPGPGNTTIRVDDVNSLEVRIEVGPLKETLSLR